MKTPVMLLILFYFILALSAKDSSTAESLFSKALSSEISFSKAASALARMIDEESADQGALYYNLGNALYLDENPIGALSAYSAALTFKPGNSDYLANRDLILKEKGLPTPVYTGSDYFIYGAVILLGWYGGCLLLILILFGALISTALYLLVNSSIFKTNAIILLLISLFLSISVFSWSPDIADRAIVKNEGAVLRQGDSPLYELITPLSAGSEMRILDERQGWYRVKTMNSHESPAVQGWLEGNHLLFASELIESLQ